MVVGQAQGTTLIREVVDRLNVSKKIELSTQRLVIYILLCCIVQLVSEVRKGKIKDKVVDIGINTRFVYVQDVDRKVIHTCIYTP